jgi:adenosylhomocysteine nucleosidase
MREELANVARSCSESGYRSLDAVAGRLSIHDFPELNLILARGGTGKVQFAVQTQHLLDSGVGPDLVICAGAAGSLVDHLQVGDIVIGTATVEHDYSEGFIDRPLPRFEADPAIVDSLSKVPNDELAFSVHFGVVASGDEDVVSEDRKQSLHKATGAIAVGWEGAGGARACRFSGVPFVEIRGITDAADEGAASDFKQNLATAMGNIAIFLIAWITQDRNH